MTGFGPTFVWVAINLLILYFALRKFLFKPVTRFMDNRVQSIKDALDQAERSNEEALELKKKYGELLHSAREEAADILDAANVRGEREYQAIVSNARLEAERTLSNAREEIERERGQMLKEIKGHVAGLALAAASKVIEANMDTQGNRALVDKFLDEEGAA